MIDNRELYRQTAHALERIADALENFLEIELFKRGFAPTVVVKAPKPQEHPDEGMQLPHPGRATEDPDDLLTAQDVADLLSVSKYSVYQMPIPRMRISPKRLRWERRDVIAFAHERRERND